MRLRVVLSQVERSGLSGRVLLDDGLYGELTAWLTRILAIGNVYPFQLG